MIKHLLLTAGLLAAVPLTLRAADNVNLMPWVNGTEWASTSVEKNADGSYSVYVTDSWAGAGIDFAADHHDFPIEGYVGVHIDVTADNAGQKMVYVNYDGEDYDEYGSQGRSGNYAFAQGKSVRKIVFKFENPGTYVMRAFTLLAPDNSEPQEILSGTWATADNGSWGAHHHINASYFADVNPGEDLLIYYTTSGRHAPQAQIYAPKKDGPVDANSASESCHLYATVTGNGIYADLDGKPNPLDIKLTEDMVKYLRLYGLSFEGHDVTFTRISLRKGNPTVDVEEMPEPTISPVTPSEGLGGVPMGVAPKSTLPGLFDGDPATYFRANRPDRAWAGLDLGEPYVIKKIKWMAADNDTWKVNLGVFEGANSPDFMDALPLHIIRSSKGAGEWNEAEVYCSRGFRYVRYVGPRRLVDVAANEQMGRCEGSHGQMAELRFFGEKGPGDDSALYRFTNLATVVINTRDMEEPHDKNVDPDKSHDLAATLSVIGADGKLVSAPGITRERGNYSRTFPKRPLRMKYDKKNTPLTGAKAKKKKWELLNNFGDKTLMRNLVAFDISRMMGLEWTPFCEPVDVVLNGEYRGCYQLTDSKEVDKNRVNIHEMTLEEALAGGEALSGGYFIEIDAYANEEPSGTWFWSEGGYRVPVTVKAPKDDDVLIPTKGNPDGPLAYISGLFSEMESRLKSGKFYGEGSYREILDVESFLQLLMVNEVGGNKDVMWSFNMYKEIGDPYLYSGPAWDFDVAFDNSRYIRGRQAYETEEGFLYKTTTSVASDTPNRDRGGFRDFTDRVMSDPQTADELRHLWGAVRDNGLSFEALAAKIDGYASLLSESQSLNFEKWPILDKAVHDNDIHYGSYEKEVEHIKDFCRKIVAHFDSKLGYVAGEHADMVSVETDDTDTAFRLSVPYGKLMVKDEPVAENQPELPARAASDGKFINSAREWSLDKGLIDSAHRITYYARHAGRETAPQTVLVTPDGAVSAVENTVDGMDDAPKEYYAITGVKVSPDETAPGVYVCRQGGKVTKVVLR